MKAKSKFWLVLTTILMIVSMVISACASIVSAQDAPPPPILFFDEKAGARAKLVEVQVVPGDCNSLDAPYFDSLGKRNLGLNEDSTRIVGFYDERMKVVCVVVWGAWPGTVGNDGVSEFDSKLKALLGTGVVFEADKPLIKSNPAVDGVPFHSYTWSVPCGGGSLFHVYVEYYQQQVLGSQRFGAALKDWSIGIRNELCKLWMPFVSKPPTPTPTPTPTPKPPVVLSCQGYTTDIKDYNGPVVSSFEFEIEPGWSDTTKTLLLYPGEIGNLRILYNRNWNGEDLSGQIEKVEVIFRRQDGSKSHDVSSRFDDLDGPLLATDMENETTNWWWLTVRLKISEGDQAIWCQQRIASIDPVLADTAKQLMSENPGMSWEAALLAADK